MAGGASAPLRGGCPDGLTHLGGRTNPRILILFLPFLRPLHPPVNLLEPHDLNEIGAFCPAEKYRALMVGVIDPIDQKLQVIHRMDLKQPFDALLSGLCIEARPWIALPPLPVTKNDLILCQLFGIVFFWRWLGSLRGRWQEMDLVLGSVASSSSCAHRALPVRSG